MRVLLDACVLYPTVMRQIVLGVAAEGLAVPLWSERIVGEWVHAAARLGTTQESAAQAESAALAAAWPEAVVRASPETEARLVLPDAADRHVLAAAIGGGADLILTLNLRDFPARAMKAAGVGVIHPDPWLLHLAATAPEAVGRVVESVRAAAERLSAQPQPLRPLMKRAGLPRLGKRLG